MMDYQIVVCGVFFDIVGVVEILDEVVVYVCYFDDGLLFLQDGKIVVLLLWQEGEVFLYLLKGYVDLWGKLLLLGFVDVYVYYLQIEMIGVFGEQLLEWFIIYIFLVESQFVDVEYVQEIVQFFVN